MQKVLRLTALSAALLAALPAIAADAVPPAAPAKTEAAKPVKPPSEMAEALMALGKEIKAAVGSGKGNPIPLLDKLAAHEYSDATRARMSKVFGSAKPLHITRSALAGGDLNYAIGAQPFSYTDSNGTTTAWTALGMTLLLDKDGRNLTTNGAWQSLSISDKDVSMTMSDMRIEGKQRRSERDVWLGKGQMDIGAIAFTPTQKAGPVLLEGVSVATHIAPRKAGTGVDASYDTRIKAVKVGGEQLDALRFALRMTNIDMGAMEKVSAGFSATDNGKQTPAMEIDMAMAQFKAMAKSLSARGSALEIEEFSAGFRGHRAVIKGKLSLAPSTDADLGSAAAMSKKVVARLNVRLPVAMVTDIGKAFMANEAKTKGKTMSPDELAQAAQTVSDVMVGKLLNGGYAKLDNGVLLSLIEIKGGKLTFNGKEVALPKPAQAKPAANGAR